MASAVECLKEVNLILTVAISSGNEPARTGCGHVKLGRAIYAPDQFVSTMYSALRT